MGKQSLIKVLLVCVTSMSSSLLEAKAMEAAQAAGAPMELKTIYLPEVSQWDWQANWVDIVLVAPQARYQRLSIAQAAEPHGIMVQDIDPDTFGLVDGEKLFQQVWAAVHERDGEHKHTP